MTPHRLSYIFAHVLIAAISATEFEELRPGWIYTKFYEMNLIPAGTFEFGFGGEKRHKYEYVRRDARVTSFYMDRYPVNVIQFKKFMKAKKTYRTDAQVFEESWMPEVIAPREYFVNRTHREETRTERRKDDPLMVKIQGADWKHPEGPDSNLMTRMREPVVHISWYDAKAYCTWMKKRLPSEMEWEYSARSQLVQRSYPWGTHFQQNRSNIWDGDFPANTAKDGFVHLAPTDTYIKQNSFGLFDMLGNVWEWTSSIHRDKDLPVRLQKTRYALRGTSYLESQDGSTGIPARISARKPAGPFETFHNVGFRCALDEHLAARYGLSKRQEL